MVFNPTFNNISVISWRSVLLVEETGVLGENHPPVVSHWQTLSHNVVSSTPRHERSIKCVASMHWPNNICRWDLRKALIKFQSERLSIVIAAQQRGSQHCNTQDSWKYIQATTETSSLFFYIYAGTRDNFIYIWKLNHILILTNVQ